MRAPLSVIVPTRNVATTLPGCFTALMEGVEAGLIRELIVCDGGSDDATLAVAEAWGAVVLAGLTPSRGGQLRHGCAAAQADWLLVLHADTRLAPGWSEVVASHLQGSDAAWFRLRFDGGGIAAHLVAGWANLRSRLGLPYGDQGLLIPRKLYEAVGGYPDQPLMEDVALVRALKGRLRGLPAQAVTSAERYRRQGWLRRGTRNLWTLTRYFAGVSPVTLGRDYTK